MTHRARIAVLTTGLLLLPMAAQAAGNGAIDTVIQRFIGRIASIEPTMTNAATDLFGALAITDMMLVCGWAAITATVFTDWLATVARVLAVLSFFYGILLKGSAGAKMIIAGFTQIGGQAAQAAGGTVVMGPTDIFNTGINVADNIWQAITLYTGMTNPGMSFLLVLSGFAEIIIFTLIAVMIIDVIVETSMMIFLGLIMLAFGGSSFTRDYAVSYVRFMISIGAKRMAMQVLVGLGAGMLSDVTAGLTTGFTPDFTTIAYLFAIPLITLMLMWRLPYRMGDLINGSVSHGAFGGFASAATAIAGAATAGVVAAAGAAAAGGAAGAAAAGGAAGQSAIAAAGPSSGGVGGAIARAGRISAAAVGNFSSAAAQDVGGRLAGQRTSHGSMGWRMAAGLNAARPQPAPPPPPATGATP